MVGNLEKGLYLGDRQMKLHKFLTILEVWTRRESFKSEWRGTVYKVGALIPL